MAYFLTCKALEPGETDEYVLKPVTEPQFWIHMYRIVSSTPIEETRYVVISKLFVKNSATHNILIAMQFYHPLVRTKFASFDALRHHPVTGGNISNLWK